MNHHHRHWLEKTQVQLATLVSVACMYFLAWPLLRPSDPLMALTFIGRGAAGNLVVLAFIIWALAALCTVMTVTGRPEGALLATALGVGGLSLRSAQVRSLVWASSEGAGPVMRDMALESLVLTFIALGAMFVIGLVRSGLVSLHPRLAWSPHLGVDGKLRRESDGDAADNRRVLEASFSWRFSLVGAVMRSVSQTTVDSEDASRRLKGSLRSIACPVIGTVIAFVLMLVLAASADRGQLIFALVVSFTLGMMIAQTIVPARWSVAVWVVPSLAASVAYFTALIVTPHTADGDWMSLPYFARALPIDWLSAGGGGALLGYWISARLRHVKKLEDQAASQKG